jgi:hypothetical protein
MATSDTEVMFAIKMKSVRILKSCESSSINSSHAVETWITVTEEGTIGRAWCVDHMYKKRTDA